MTHSEEIRRLQDATLSAISFTRDSISTLFRNDTIDQVDHTLMRLVSYLSNRSQTVSFLVSHGFVWDAEIVLRSCSEAAVKIWFICAAAEEERDRLANEFWGSLQTVHDHKRARKALVAAELFASNSRPDEAINLQSLANPEIFPGTDAAKKTRRAIEQRWSFQEIVAWLEKHSPADFPMRGATALAHGYGLQSHLIHADETALDLMLDRALRKPEELVLLEMAHVARIFSDQLSFWTFSALALRYLRGIVTPSGDNLWEVWREVHELTLPLQQRFAESQRAFYQKMAVG